MSKPLNGVRVLELSTFVAAPACARLLADLGAEVIKVERPGGDTWRQTGVNYNPSRFSDDENPVFDIYNSGKKHIAINLKSQQGMEVFQKLLAQADVFITNTRPAALQRLGISYEQVKEKHPSLIYAIVLGYGENGPDAEKPAFDTTAFWSRSGFLRDQAIAGEGYMPVSPPYSVGDTVCGYLLLAEVCAALYRRNQTGMGDYLRSGLYHNAIYTMGTMAIISQKPFGREYPRSRIDHGVPGGYYECADGEWIYVATGYAAALIPKLCRAIGRPELAEDPRYATDAERWENRQEYYQIFRDAFLTKTSDQWIKIADELDLPVMRMAHYSDIAQDEQAWANDYLEHVTFVNGNVDVMPSSPIEMDSVGQIKTKPAPSVGAHTQQLLAELGYTNDQIRQMYDAGAVCTKE